MSITHVSHIPPGSQDLLGEAVRHRRRVQRAWFDLSEARGYAEVIPPTFEYEEVFTLGGGPDLSRRLLRFLDRDGRVVALRADYTSAIARIAATRLSGISGPVRLSYAGKVYRQEREGGGRTREMFQVGAELMGEAAVEADVEIVRLVIDTLRSLRIEEFQLNVGDIRFLRPLLAPFADRDAERVRTAIDRKDRVALHEMATRLPSEGPVRRALRALPELIGRAEVLRRAGELACDADAAAAIDRLRALHDALTEDERARMVYDLGEIRGLHYYTGLQFEVFVAGVGRAVGFGGRYDDLLANYGSDRPAVGFTLNQDALADVMQREAA